MDLHYSDAIVIASARPPSAFPSFPLSVDLPSALKGTRTHDNTALALTYYRYAREAAHQQR